MSEFVPVIVWQVGDEHLRKQHRSLAELHYSKAVSLFLSLKDAPCELLRTLLERVAFAEFTMAGKHLFIRSNMFGRMFFFKSNFKFENRKVHFHNVHIVILKAKAAA